MSATPTIGASELAVAVGLQRRHADGTPWTSSLELWARLRGLLPRYDDDGGPDAEAGLVMEPGIGAAYAKTHGLTWGPDIAPGPQMPAPGLQHADLPWLRVRPDFLVPARQCVLQAKAPREIGDEWGQDGTDDAPVWVVVQEVAELAIVYRLVGWETADIAVHARAARRGDRTSATYTLHRDEDLERRLLLRAHDWYRKHVEDGQPPPPDGSPSASSALSRMFRPADRELVATADDVRRWSHLLQLRGARDDMEARVREEEQRLQARMGEHTALVHDGRRLVTWRPRAGSQRIDLARLRRERPDIAQQFALTSEPTRTFRVESEV